MVRKDRGRAGTVTIPGRRRKKRGGTKTENGISSPGRKRKTTGERRSRSNP